MDYAEVLITTFWNVLMLNINGLGITLLKILL